MFPEPVVIAFFTTLGAIAAAITAIYSTRRTMAQAESAQVHDEEVARDQLGLEQLKELARQNREDREDMRKERAELYRRVSALERQVAELAAERAMDRRTIRVLEAEIAERKRVRHILLRYIHTLREFIAGLGQTPPDPDEPLPLT